MADFFKKRKVHKSNSISSQLDKMGKRKYWKFNKERDYYFYILIRRIYCQCCLYFILKVQIGVFKMTNRNFRKFGPSLWALVKNWMSFISLSWFFFKMEHALKEEVEIHVEAVQKYEKKLDRLAGLLDVYNAETTRIGNDIDLLNKEKEDKYLEKSNIFNKAVSREREIGIGLISTKTGKEIPDKVRCRIR